MLVLTGALERTVEAVLRMAVRSGAPALAVSAERLLSDFEKRRAAKLTPVTERQLVLWTEKPDGSLERWRGRLPLDACVDCKAFGATLPLRTCLLRQGSTWPGGNKLKDGSVRKKKAGIHPYCASKRCEQGNLYAASVAGAWAPPVYSEFRRDTPQQLAARERYLAVSPDAAANLDRVPEITQESEALDPEDELDLSMISKGCSP